MRKLGVSLCILTHNRIAETANLIGSLRGFEGIDLEVCIADQESETDARIFAQQTADNFTEVSDHDLWFKGFGYAKQKAVELASNPWVVVGDPGEVWYDITGRGECQKLAQAIRNNNSIPSFRTYYGAPRQVQMLLDGKANMRSMSMDVCRIFDKRKMRIAGYIHEAPVHKETGRIWAAWARKYKPVGVIEHVDQVMDSVPAKARENRAGEQFEDAYIKRKRFLYDHLLHMIVKNPKLRHGTDFRWWTAHWNTVVAPRFKEISFEEWKAIGG